MTDIRKRFVTSATAPAPTAEQREDSRQITETIIQAAAEIDGRCLDGRWKSLALTQLEEALMWANKSIYNEEKR